jgi:hypothetical protein
MPVTTRTHDTLVVDKLDEDDQPRALWERAVGWGIVAIATILVFNVLNAGHNWGHLQFKFGIVPWWDFSNFHFGDLFLNTTANGGDMGAHVWWPKFLAEHWFTKGRLAGWTPDWYAGFPVGQYYFPLPAVAVAALDLIMPYNVAFKLVTVSGPLLMPAGAYYFARGMRAPWPAPPAFALAAMGLLMETRYNWQIYGGNIASTLAGEFSFTIGLALALFALGALAYTLDTGERRWLPAALIAAAVLSHIVVAIFIGIAATLLWLTRKPRRTFPLAAAIGGVALAIPAVWLLPLLTNHNYTQSMRYTKLLPDQGARFTMWTWLDAPNWLPFHGFVQDHLTGPVHNTVNGFMRAVQQVPGSNGEIRLWLPMYIWALAAVAIVAAGYYRRRSTFVLLILAIVLGILFVQWPEHAIWNTRFLPFWLLTWGFLAAMGAAELLRLLAMVARWAYRWIRDGDLQDARNRAWAEIATSDDADPDAKKDAVWALAERRFEKDPEGWEPPERLSRATIDRQARLVGSIALAVLVGISGIFALNRAWDARDNNPSIQIAGWAAWNYSGYERKAAYPQYKAVMDGMAQVADEHGNGRALWEPSSGEPDALNSYGTSLALELLPHFTNGRIGSMEGIYFESSATTAYHFLAVAECAAHPSNPVRGEVYGTLEEDFDLCVKHLQMMGVRYLMLWSKEANAKAEQSDDLTLVKTIPQNPAIPAPSSSQLSEWRVYQVANSDLVVGMDQQPVVVTDLKGDTYSKCWDTTFNDTLNAEPELSPWECTTAPWWTDRDALDTLYAADGPKEWTRVPADQIKAATPTPIEPVAVTDVERSVDEISFHVEEVGKPVVVRESFYPNWNVDGAKGPYRLAPNFMVVIPTEKDVTLSYGLTRNDWLGRFITIGGVVGLVLLALWTGGRRFAAGARRVDDNGSSDNGGVAADDAAPAGRGDEPASDDADEEPDPPHGPEPEPPDRKEPAPALP